METIIKSVSYNELDFDEFARLQQTSFRTLLRSRGFTEKHLTSSFFKWKYNGPFGKAVINLSLTNGEIVASSTIMPMQMQFDDEKFTIWNCGDNAALPELKAKSNFRGAFRASLLYPSEKSLVYGFPNENAMNTIIKTGGEIKQTIPFYVKTPFSMPFTHYTQSIVENSSGISRLDISNLFLRKGEMNITKSSRYLDWRYGRNPINTYKVLVSYNRLDDVSGMIVTRNLLYRGVKFILIMELYANNPIVSCELIHYVSSLYRGRFAILSISNCDQHYGWRQGFIKLPNTVLPKPQIMTTFNRGMDNKIYQAPMKIQTGDWDTF